jgi:hypothetical protein
MKRFIVIYNAPPEAMASMTTATPEEKEEGMKAWLAWKDSMGEKVLDLGAPLVGGQRIFTGGNIEASDNKVAGYSIIQATDMDEAVSSLTNHPHLQWTEGCNIEVHQCIEM